VTIGTVKKSMPGCGQRPRYGEAETWPNDAWPKSGWQENIGSVGDFANGGVREKTQ
jgi:hypothetical protein